MLPRTQPIVRARLSLLLISFRAVTDQACPEECEDNVNDESESGVVPRE